MLKLGKDTGMQKFIDRHFCQAGVTLASPLELNNVGTISQFVKASFGFAMLPLSTAKMIWTPGLAIHQLEGAPQRALAMVTRRHDEMSELTMALIQLIKVEAEVMLGAAPGSN
ncbi:hypothetical protein A9974_24105 [Achromobacter sp. UMC71]|nr:hypothetical protein [Achromobacter sp. UMC71]